MTWDGAEYRAERDALIGPDLLPTCPHCYDLCPVDAKWCARCGVWLRLDGPMAGDLHSRAMQSDESAGAESPAVAGDSPVPSSREGKAV